MLHQYHLVYICPDIKAQDDARIIRETLENSPGIESCEVDVPTHTVKVVSANQDADHEIRHMLSSAGFPPED